MQELLTTIASASGLIEKGGIIGLLLMFGGLLGYGCVRLRSDLIACHKQREAELTSAFKQRDKARFALVKCRAALEANGIKVDLSDISDLLGDEA